MATIRERSGKLIADFRYMGIRCRETTNLEDNAYNRRILKNVSNSLKLKLLWELLNTKSTFQKVTVLRSLRKKKSANCYTDQSSSFKEFTELWFKQKQVEWRTSYQQKVSIVIKNYLIPAFGNQVLSKIKKSDLLNFRASLAKVTHGKTKNAFHHQESTRL